MSNLHVNLDEANKHDPKGFIPALNHTFLVKSETGVSYYEERMVMTKAINFVDGTLPPPSNADYDAYVIIGSGTVDGGWGNAAFGDWIRFFSSIPDQVTPLQGYLCYDNTAAQWMEYNGASWVAFGGGGGVTNLGVANITATNLDVTSDTGTDATLPSATASDAGLMPASKFNEVVTNNAKVSADGSVDTHSDVDTTTTTPVIGEALVWDGSNWINSNIYLATGATPATALKLHQELLSGVGRLTWEGTTGGLFTIIDDKDNELWTASDVSGNPIGYIDADWNVKLGNPFNRPFEIRHDSTTGIDYTKFVLPDYANDAAADADAALLSGESYTTSAVDRNIKIKP